MANEAIDGDDLLDDEEGASGGKKKLIILIAVALLLIGGGAAAFFILDPLGSEEEVVAGEEKIEAPEPVVFFPLPAITVNLENVAGRQQFLKLKATLELRDQGEIAKIEPFMPRVLDAFQVYLRELRTTDMEGSAGMFRLKEELQRRINVAVYPVEVRKILFEEILVQ